MDSLQTQPSHTPLRQTMSIAQMPALEPSRNGVGPRADNGDVTVSYATRCPTGSEDMGGNRPAGRYRTGWALWCARDWSFMT